MKIYTVASYRIALKISTVLICFYKLFYVISFQYFKFYPYHSSTTVWICRICTSFAHSFIHDSLFGLEIHLKLFISGRKYEYTYYELWYIIISEKIFVEIENRNRANFEMVFCNCNYDFNINIFRCYKKSTFYFYWIFKISFLYKC